MTDMIVASFLQIWHIIPIVIAIIIFRKFLNNKDKNRRIQINEEHEKNGLSLELRTGRKYEDLGYNVIYSESEDAKKEQGIDLICSKGDKTLLVQCKKDSTAKSITSEDIKTFATNAIKFLKSNNIDDKGVEFRYVILYPGVLHKSAVKVFSDDTYNCKYMVL